MAAPFDAFRYAHAHRDQVVWLSQNTNHLVPPEVIRDALDEAIRARLYEGYPLASGDPELLELARADLGIPGAVPFLTGGGTESLYMLTRALLRPGDEVVASDPSYLIIHKFVELTGATTRCVDIYRPPWRLTADTVQEAIGPKTRMILLNTPHNPTGSILRPEDMEQLRGVVAGTSILIHSDEVYEHLIFDNIPHQSILRYPDLLERGFVSFSFGKVYHCTGWKLGYSVSSPALMKEFRKVHQFNCFSCHTPSQVGLAEFLKDKTTYLSLGAFLQQKRDYFGQLMAATKFTPLPSYGSYFQLYQYDRISDEADKDFAIRITKEYGVASIPVSAFYQDGKDDRVVRFCFAKKTETLEKAVERLVKI